MLSNSTEPVGSPVPGVIPEEVRVTNGPLPAEPEVSAETRGGRFRRAWRRGFGGASSGDAPSRTRMNDELDELNQAWRRNIVSHVNGLEPPVDPDRDHVRGPAGAPVTLVEYGEYQSVNCRAAAPGIEELRERFGADLRFVFRHFPIGDAHPLALYAAEVAEAAGDQGKFWEMHEAMLGGDLRLAPEMLRKLALRFGLDADRFDSELGDETHLSHILDDFRGGARSGVNGTPTFFINGERLEWDFEIATLGQALEQAGAGHQTDG
jgi:protein-disulfide isomerase